MSSNSAAWIKEAKSNPFKVESAPVPKLGPNDLLVKNSAVAINPVDWKIQDSGYFVQSYPFILGTDVAGTIAEVGSEVKDFKAGDRVLAHCIGLATGQAEENAFQQYSRVRANMTSVIPSSASFTDAVVLPLAISTAAAGLYQSTYLNLPYPSSSPKDSGKVILVWGGSSSVGSTAIQLALASGVEVITTASSHNHTYCKNLGAKAVIDYNSSSVVEDIVSAIKASGKEFAGVYDSISHPDTLQNNYKVLQQAGGAKKIATVLPPGDDVPAGVEAQGVFAPLIALQTPEVAEAVWGKYVPKALAEGSLKFLPEPLIVGKGLEKIQEALDVQKKGVSAKKVVVEL